MVINLSLLKEVIAIKTSKNNNDLIRVLQELKEQKYEAVKPKQIKEIVKIEEWLTSKTHTIQGLMQ